jgi:adenylate cyclase class 2
VYEVELKFHLADVNHVVERLDAMSACFRDSVEQVDRYFSHPVRNFRKTDEALRLRQVGDSVQLTWKGPRVDTSAKVRQEIELGVMPQGPTGQTTVAAWTELLESLGFYQVFVHWHGSDIEIAIDTVANLGSYAEFEIIAGEGEVPLARDCVESLARELGLENPEPASYLELLAKGEEAPR